MLCKAQESAPTDRRQAIAQIGVVIIGRNEGERLRRCLQSIVGRMLHVVYVDSGSTDGSVEYARSLGVDVLELDLTRPFTAARARNAGLQRLLELVPRLEFVQFVDGDCEIIDGWFETGLMALRERPEAVAVFGRVVERYPERSLYNRLCDLDWDRPLGETPTCGGIALMRVAPIQDAGGFDESLIAGEEPELCYRLRRNGGVILRIEPAMVHHDAAILYFRQWWRRTLRTGHAYAEGASLHGKSPERYGVRSMRRSLFWGIVLPTSIVLLVVRLGPPALCFAGLYLWLWIRVFLYERKRQRPARHAALVASFTALGKIPEAVGVLTFHLNRLRRRRTGLIEYKEPVASSSVLEP